jgi:histidine phosphotransferase ChpT
MMKSQEKGAAGETALAEALTARLCHDIAGPLGAVEQGLDLLAEDSGDREVRAFLEASARSAAHRLAFFRLAFGPQGPARRLDRAELGSILTDFLADRGICLDWPGDDAFAELPADLIALLPRLMHLAAGALPRGGTVTLAVPPEADVTLGVMACGNLASLPAAIRDALNQGIAGDAFASPSPRTVTAYLAGRSCHAFGMAIDIREGEGAVRFRLSRRTG